jgi:ribosome-associated toxin RatA of RatAB toxin-antitoxin module
MQIVPILIALVASTVGLTEPELATALRGEVPVRSETFATPTGKASGRGIGAIIVDRPIEEVWAVVSHYEDKAEYQPRVEKVWVLEKHPDYLKVRMQINASVTTARYTARFDLDPVAHTVHWKLDKTAPDNTIVDCDGGYQLAELSPTRTLVVYRGWVDSGRSVPRFIQEYMTRRSIPNLLRAVKKRVESGGTWRKGAKD